MHPLGYHAAYDLHGIRQALLLGGGFVILDIALRLRLQALVGVGAFDGSVRLVEDLLDLLDQGLDLVDELGFVAVLFLSRLHGLDVLCTMSSYNRRTWWRMTRLSDPLR